MGHLNVLNFIWQSSCCSSTLSSKQTQSLRVTASSSFTVSGCKFCMLWLCEGQYQIFTKQCEKKKKSKYFLFSARVVYMIYAAYLSACFTQPWCHNSNCGQFMLNLCGQGWCVALISELKVSLLLPVRLTCKGFMKQNWKGTLTVEIIIRANMYTYSPFIFLWRENVFILSLSVQWVFTFKDIMLISYKSLKTK